MCSSSGPFGPYRVTRELRASLLTPCGLVDGLDGFEVADDRHLDLAGEDHLVGDLARDLARQLDGAEVVDLPLADVDAHLAAALHGDGAGDAAEARADALEVLELGGVALGL